MSINTKLYVRLSFLSLITLTLFIATMAQITLESQSQPFTRQLKVITQVINDNGGNMTANDFNTRVYAPYPVSPSSFQGNESGVIVQLIHSYYPTFKVEQARHDAYSTSYDGLCVNEFF